MINLLSSEKSDAFSGAGAIRAEHGEIRFLETEVEVRNGH